MDCIKIKGARENNLKDISIDIPRGKLVVVTGVSGSGKSSLVFDTLFAEGQRRFVESLSSFARQFLGRMSKPNVDDIAGISPAIVIEQKVNTKNPRSIVGTSTEIYEYLKLLYAGIGKTISPKSGLEVKKHTVNDIIGYIDSICDGSVIYLLKEAGLNGIDDRIERLISLREEGFSRLFSIKEGKIYRIDEVIQNEKSLHLELFLLIDRVIKESSQDFFARVSDSFNVAGENLFIVYDAMTNIHRGFSSRFEADGLVFEEPSVTMFSFNNPIGACPTCSGYGKVVGIDEDLVIPDKGLSIYQEAVSCWRGEVMSSFYRELLDNSDKFDLPIHRAYRDLTKEQKELLWSGNEYFTGINGFFKMVEAARYKIQYRCVLSRYSGKKTCPDCDGTRLRKEASFVKVSGASISDLLKMSVSELIFFLQNIDLTEHEKYIAERPLKELLLRLECMQSVGLSYLTMDRPSNTLSGGESQRINLVSMIGSSLVGALYILDEPSIGLHSRDTKRLISVMRRLRDMGNSVIVVEHDEEIIRSADWLIDIGPLAGEHGGEVVYEGVLKNNFTDMEINNSKTLSYLSGKDSIETPQVRRSWRRYIELSGASEHNLKNISVKFPLKVMTAVIGVSGSGKSTLIGDLLYPALCRKLKQSGGRFGGGCVLSGDIESISSVEYIDQNPIGRSSRSNPITYLKIYDDIRKLYSDQPYAKSNGYGHSHFSFNIDSGRCPDCLGEGVITIEMQFMADIRMVCDSCGGKRFKKDILEVRYKGKSISDILNMSVDEAFDFFNSQGEPLALRIAEKLRPLQAVGLSYVKLGQSSSTLSGGESQRVKLASFLSKESQQDSILFIFDEPTTGLHFYDIKRLLDSFNALIDRGHSIIVVEHNRDVIKSCDWIIELGPDGGDRGGEVIYEGPYIANSQIA